MSGSRAFWLILSAVLLGACNDSTAPVSQNYESLPADQVIMDAEHYITADGIYEVDVATSGQTLSLSRPRRLFARRALVTEFGADGFDVGKDGRLLLLEQVTASTARLVHVVLNWTPRRAPGT